MLEYKQMFEYKQIFKYNLNNYYYNINNKT
jgi:hypothetical protein